MNQQYGIALRRSWFAPLLKGGLTIDEIRDKAHGLGIKLGNRERLESIKVKILNNYSVSLLPQWETGSVDCNTLQCVGKQERSKRLVYLRNYTPIQLDKDEFVRHVSLLLNLINNCPGVRDKLFICYRLYSLIAVNEWFVRKYEKFSHTIKNKLYEFSESKYRSVRDFAAEHAWMHDI